MQRNRCKWLCLFVVCTMLFTTTVFANDHHSTVNVEDDEICVSNLVTVPLTSVMVWNIENTGEKPLYYDVMSLSRPKDKFESVANGTLSAGQRICGSKCAVDLKTNQYFILLYGEGTTGKAELAAK